MVIRQGTFLFWWAYWNVSKESVPSRTDLCHFFWRCVWRVGFNAVVIPLMLVAGLVMVIVGGGLGYRFALAKGDSGDSVAVPIQHLPRVRGIMVRPIYVIAAVALFAKWSAIMSALASVVRGLAVAGTAAGSFLANNWVLLSLASALLISFLVFAWHRWIRHSQMAQLCRERARAYKEKVCPLITIEKAEISSNG